MSLVRTVIVDDQDLVRSGLTLILREEHGITVVGACSDGDEVLDAVAQLQPHCIVMDLRMKRMGGVEATRLLSAQGGPPVLALTTFDDDELLSGVLRAGAAGFVLKDSPAEELIRAVRTVGCGMSYLDPAITARVLQSYRRTAEPAAADDRLDALTPRERHVLVEVAKGCTNGEIANTLSISELTVKTHIGRIFTKLNVRDRAAAIVYAYEHGVAARS